MLLDLIKWAMVCLLYGADDQFSSFTRCKLLVTGNVVIMMMNTFSIWRVNHTRPKHHIGGKILGP